MIKGIIFDLDGVIVSTDELHYMSWKMIADKENIPFDRTVNHQLRGISRADSLEIILKSAKKSYTKEEKTYLITEKNNYYVSLLSELSHKDLLPQVLPTLDYLKKKGYKLAIGSSSKNAKIILSKLNITNTFDAIIDGNDLSASKPNPEVFIKAGKSLGLSSSECVVVEDAEAGIDAAKAANMLAIGISQAAEYHKTDIRLESIFDLVKHL